MSFANDIDSEVCGLQMYPSADADPQLVADADNQQMQTHTRIFTALHGMQTRSSDENSVCLSVCLSVCSSKA